METRARSPDFLKDPTARTLLAGDLEAVFLPAHGMLGASLRHRGEEILRRVEDLEAAAAKGSTAGIPLLPPWANRLAEPRYSVAGHDVENNGASARNSCRHTRLIGRVRWVFWVAESAV